MALEGKARAKFLVDAERCIECNACVTACKNENEVPWGINRRRVVTIGDGKPGERSISVACMHCSDAPCMAVCPVDVFYQTEDGIVLHSKDLCIGCGYCFYACPSVRLSSPRRATLAAGARWTNARSVQAALKKTIQQLSSPSTAATALPRASCQSVPKCARPKRCWPVMAARWQTSIASVW